MVLLDNDGFLTQLTHLLQKTRTSGSVNITMKRYHGQTRPKPKPRGAKKLQKLTMVEQEGESRCLFRATNGKKKLSTVVSRTLVFSELIVLVHIFLLPYYDVGN
ncbi:RNA-binding signal recognition particle subunit srp14 [Desmophyllum pertusum]|uniref:Signal recognition particle 14 kDa protein n=1 Tax=Desmophyllum pertusum TaxID=174260 RepID=A0A9W9Z1A1_9CNID|nr:RNA-binding signal recognition particle subunit srp14 [Desmophyllum pertusum]